MLKAGTESQRSESQGVFATTHWSVIAAAADTESPQAQEALADLCRAYWYPIYAHIRSRGYNPHDAQDLTQGLFLRLLQKDFLMRVKPQKGRFRSYLLGAVKHFLADESERKNAQKRGGGKVHISFDAMEAEDRFLTEQADDQTPDRLFDRRWAWSLLDGVMERLRAEQTEESNAAVFEALRPHLVAGAEDKSYASVASALGVSETAVRQAVCHLRQRYHRLFWDEISHTVSTRIEAEEEVRYLCSVIGD